MTDFARTMVVAILILAAALLLTGVDFGFTGSGGGGDGFRFGDVDNTIGPDRDRQGADKKGIFVGTVGVEDFDRINLDSPFKVSLLQMKTAHADFDDLWIANGLYRDVRKIVAFQIDDMEALQGGTLTGKVEDTNRYGDLLVRFNGAQLVDSNLETGDTFQVDVPPEAFSNRTNRLEIAATSSTWRIWAPTVYITDLKFESGVEGETAREVTFDVPEDNLPANKGRFTFNAELLQGDGPVNIRVNGQPVYNDIPGDRLQVVDFSGDFLRATDNEVTFRSGGNAEWEISDLELLYFFDQTPSTPSQSFTLDEDDVEDLPGTLTFTINRIFREPTGLEVDLFSSDGTQTKVIPQGIIQEGQRLQIKLTKSNVGEGENIIRFTVKGRGGMELTNLRVNP